MSQFINEQGRKALIEVAEWLESGAPHVVEQTGEVVVGFDMGMSHNDTDCGTVCCIAGAVVAFNPEAFPQFIDPDKRAWFSNDDGNSVFDSVVEYTGLSRHDASRLFEPSDMRSRTPVSGASVIRKFLETGDARWPDLF